MVDKTVPNTNNSTVTILCGVQNSIFNTVTSWFIYGILDIYTGTYTTVMVVLRIVHYSDMMIYRLCLVNQSPCKHFAKLLL